MTDTENAIINAINKIVDERVGMKVNDGIVHDVCQDIINDTDLSDFIDSSIVEDSVRVYMNYNYDVDRVVRDIVEDSIVNDDAVEEAMSEFVNANPEFMKDLIVKYFKTEDGKQLIRDVFASLIKDGNETTSS